MVPWRSARSLVRARWFTVGKGTEPHGPRSQPGQQRLYSAPVHPAYLWQPGAQWAGPGRSPGVQESAGSAIWRGRAGRWTSRPRSWWSSAASDPPTHILLKDPIGFLTTCTHMLLLPDCGFDPGPQRSPTPELEHRWPAFHTLKSYLQGCRRPPQGFAGSLAQLLMTFPSSQEPGPQLATRGGP